MEKKSRIIETLVYLYENTDEEHPATTVEILKHLESIGIKAYRTTVSSDVEKMVAAGIDVVCIKSSPNKYFVGSRTFETPELKLLIDAVTTAKFITKKKTERLIEKIANLGSKNEAKLLKEELPAAKIIKPNNEKIYYNIDKIRKAIDKKRRISFQYLSYNADKEAVYKHEGYRYEVSPFDTIWNDGRYYCVGHSQRHGKTAVFRLERMDNVKIVRKAAEEKPEDYDSARYTNEVFEMYDVMPAKVTLLCANEMMDVIVDKFGKDVETKKVSDGQFEAYVKVNLSPRFYGWVFGFAGKIKIKAPETVKAEYAKLARQALK